MTNFTKKEILGLDSILSLLNQFKEETNEYAAQVDVYTRQLGEAQKNHVKARANYTKLKDAISKIFDCDDIEDLKKTVLCSESNPTSEEQDAPVSEEINKNQDDQDILPEDQSILNNDMVTDTEILPDNVFVDLSDSNGNQNDENFPDEPIMPEGWEN